MKQYLKFSTRNGEVEIREDTIRTFAETISGNAFVEVDGGSRYVSTESYWTVLARLKAIREKVAR